jgi:hypothetical protein
MTREQVEEQRVFDYIHGEVTRELRPNKREELLLLRSRTPEEYEEAVNTILADRGEQTRPARQAKAERLRADRRARGADRTGVRGGGAAKSRSTKMPIDGDKAIDFALEEAFA